MYLASISYVIYFAFWVAMSKTFYKPPMKKENGKFVELSQEVKNYQYHDLVSLVYSFTMIAMYIANYFLNGLDFEREGTNMEKQIVILGMIWYSFDLVLKYFDGVHKVFVWIHHPFTILSMIVSLASKHTYWFGATGLFINDVIHIFLVIHRTYENINYPHRKLKFQINFSLLVLSFILSRVIGTHWLIYKWAMSSKVSSYIIIGSTPILCFGTIISIKLLSKFWKYIPHWCRDKERAENNKIWTKGRKVFKMYQSKGIFSHAVNSLIGSTSFLLPIGLTLYTKMNHELMMNQELI